MLDEFFEERIAIVQEGNHWSAAEAEAFCRTLFQAPVPPSPEPTPQAITLRPYQQRTLDALLDALAEGEHPVASVATGGGKSLIIAALCAKLDGRVLVVTHRKKLLEQNSKQLARYLGIDEDIGVYSAGLDQRDTTQRVLFGGVASIYKRMPELQRAGRFEYVIVDEAHLCPPPSQEAMYRQVFLGCYPGVQRIGLSATPSRAGIPIWGHEDRWFSCCSVTVGIKELTPEYLTPLTGIFTAQDVDLSKVRVQKGEFVQSDASQAMSEEKVARAALDEACALAAQRQAWMVFCCDVAHTQLIHGLLTERGIPCGQMHSQQSSDDNDAALQAFTAGETRALISCDMLTTGVDIPRADCGILLRPTMSKELLVQMLGRLTRQHPGKTDALILDYAGNLDRHAPLDELTAKETTPARQKRDAEEQTRTEQERERERLARHAQSVVSGDTYAVARMSYESYAKRTEPSKHLLRVSYYCPAKPGDHWVHQYLCYEGYTGYPRQQAAAWFARRGRQAPATAADAELMARTLPMPEEITVAQDWKFWRVVMEYFSQKETE